MNRIASLFIALLIVGASCEKKQTGEENKDTSAVDSTKHHEKKVKSELVFQWSTDSTLKTCESVLFDKNRNVLYVSSIVGKDPLKKDNDGFIAIVTPDGKIQKEKWVTGLNAPKGSGLSGGKLYVTDIDVLVEIDTAKGKIIKKYPVKGAKFLNDIAVGDDGTVYFTDSGTNKIHSFKDGKVEVFKEDNLNGPNGLFVKDGKLYLSSMGSEDFKVIDLATKKDSVIATGVGKGDGVEYTGKDDQFLVSNWEGQVFLVKKGKAELLLDTKAKNLQSADIGFIPEQNIVLVPTFYGNRVDAYSLTLE